MAYARLSKPLTPIPFSSLQRMPTNVVVRFNTDDAGHASMPSFFLSSFLASHSAPHSAQMFQLGGHSFKLPHIQRIPLYFLSISPHQTLPRHRFVISIRDGALESVLCDSVRVPRSWSPWSTAAQSSLVVGTHSLESPTPSQASRVAVADSTSSPTPLSLACFRIIDRPLIIIV